MSKYIELTLVLNKLWRLCEEDIDAEILEAFDFSRAREALSDLPTIEVSEDCISREWVKGICENMLDEEMLGHMLGYIEDAPSVVPSRAEGEWVEVVKRTEQYDREGVKSWAVIYQCPYCGFVLNAIENHTAQYNYCPNCGAKMKG